MARVVKVLYSYSLRLLEERADQVLNRNSSPFFATRELFCSNAHAHCVTTCHVMHHMTSCASGPPTLITECPTPRLYQYIPVSMHSEATTDGPPAAKKSKMEDAEASNGPTSSYIPTETSDSPQFSVVFSMKEEKGALVKALELCKVSWNPAHTLIPLNIYLMGKSIFGGKGE